MEFMPWFDFLRPKLKEQEAEFSRSPEVTFGATGTEIYGGYIEEEFLGELRSGRERYEKYHEMRSSSGVIKMCLKSTRDPIRGASWGFRAKVGEDDQDPNVQQQIDFMERSLTLDKLHCLVNDMTTSIIFGFYVGEIYFKPFSFEGKIMLRPCVKYISQKTVDRWLVDKDEGLLGIEQFVYGDTAVDSDGDYQGRIEIQRNKLIHMAIDADGDNYEGISMLRPCYGPYVRRNVNYKKIAIGNHFLSMPYLKIYKEEDGEPPEDQMRKFEQRLRERSKGGKTLSHIVFPKGWKAEEQKSAFDPKTLYECNEKEDTEIVRAFCANFLLLTKGSGSHALSNDLSTFFLKSLEEVGKLIDISITRDLIEKTIEVNFDQDCLIECYHSEIGEKGGEKLAEALSKLVSSKAVRMDDPTEEWIREKYGLPKSDPETVREEAPETAELVNFSKKNIVK